MYLVDTPHFIIRAGHTNKGMTMQQRVNLGVVYFVYYTFSSELYSICRAQGQHSVGQIVGQIVNCSHTYVFCLDIHVYVHMSQMLSQPDDRLCI